jgi:hypothetical protein
MCGEEHLVSIGQPCVIIDSHMHIQSGRCAPLQYVRSLFALTSTMTRKWIEESGVLGGRLLEFLFEPVSAPYRALERAFSDTPENSEKEFFEAFPFRKLTEQSKKSTFEISQTFMTSREKVYQEYFLTSPCYRDVSHLAMVSVVMTMDMEYAHIDGYFGIGLYNALYKSREDLDANKPCAYWTPQHGRWVERMDRTGHTLLEFRSGVRGAYTSLADDSKKPRTLPETDSEYQSYGKAAKQYGLIGKYHDKASGKGKEVRLEAIPVLLPDSETDLYENWRKQLQLTEQAVLTKPLQLLPMFHYDPRRWQLHGNHEPMSKVGEQGIYLGFKMYTAQGYRPWDPWLPVLEDFYVQCCTRRIPIMNHCTPLGAATFERKLYRDFQHPGRSAEDDSQKEGLSALDYFNEHYVSPAAWKKVLDRTITLDDEKTQTCREIALCDLHLCLAHLGGPTETGKKWGRQIIDMIESRKYPHLYTDISSSFADDQFRADFKEMIQKHPRIKSRILFGTDWFLTLNYSNFPRISKDYWDYCVETKQFLDSFDTSLWPKFIQHNPYSFYCIANSINRISGNISKLRSDLNIEDVMGEIKVTNEINLHKLSDYLKSANYFNPSE